MGLYSESNAGTAQLVALAAIIGGIALITESMRPSGLVFATGGVILFFGVGDEVSATTTHDILPTIIFFSLMAVGVTMFANGF